MFGARSAWTGCATEGATNRGRYNQADHRELQSECAFVRGVDDSCGLVRGSEDYGIGAADGFLAFLATCWARRAGPHAGPVPHVGVGWGAAPGRQRRR